jgi:hypothetical protein
MKKYIVFLFSLLFIFLNCSKQDTNQKIDNNSSTSSIKIDPVFFNPIETEGISVDGHYPKISGLKNKEFEDRLNNIFTRNVNDFIYSSAEGTVNSTLSFEILTLNDSILSLSQESSGMVDGTGTSAGIRLEVVTVNADLKNARILTNEDLNVKQVGLSNFKKIVNSYFRNICGYGDMFWEDYISNPKSNDDLMKLQFGIKDGNLVEMEFGTPCSFASRGIYLIPLAKIGPEFQVQQGSPNIQLSSSDTLKIISEVTDGSQKQMEGRYLPKVGKCDSIVSCNLEFIDLDFDNYPEVRRTYYGSQKCFGAGKSETAILKRDSNGKWNEIIKFNNGEYPQYLSSFNNGLKDIIIQKDTNQILLRWNGNKYEESPITTIHFNFTESQSSINKKEAVRQITEWIENLGKRDFRAAYEIMSPSIRGDFESFSSNKKYGGITSTKVYSEDIYSYKVSECIFEVTVTYDSYDPSNSNGKFTDLFTINNCKGHWEISSIKRIFKEKL